MEKNPTTFQPLNLTIWKKRTQGCVASTQSSLLCFRLAHLYSSIHYTISTGIHRINKTNDIAIIMLTAAERNRGRVHFLFSFCRGNIYEYMNLWRATKREKWRAIRGNDVLVPGEIYDLRVFVRDIQPIRVSTRAKEYTFIPKILYIIL